MNKHVIYRVITILFVLTQTFPPINFIVPSSSALLKFAIFDAVSVMLFPVLLSKRSVIAVFLFSVVAFLFFITGNAFFDSFSTVIVPFLIMLSALFIAEYATKYDTDYKYTRIVVLVALFSNILMAIVSIPQVIVNPYIIRPSYIDTMGIDNYYWLISYHTCHGLPILFAPLVFLCRKAFRISKLHFLLWLTILAILFIIVFLSNATTAMLISIMMVGIGLLFKMEQFSKRTISVLTLFSISSFLLLQPPVAVPIINTLQHSMDPSTLNYRRMEEIKDELIYGESSGDWDTRQSLYENSLNLFIESPLIGTQRPENISHHSWLIDRLACFGLIFFVPVVLIFVFFYKDIFSGIRHTKVIGTFGLLGFLLMLLLKNDFGPGSWLYGLAFLPLLCRYIDCVIDKNSFDTK